jgi:hypothetical protein
MLVPSQQLRTMLACLGSVVWYNTGCEENGLRCRLSAREGPKTLPGCEGIEA